MTDVEDKKNPAKRVKMNVNTMSVSLFPKVTVVHPPFIYNSKQDIGSIGKA
jgi:hypothetical protein